MMSRPIAAAALVVGCVTLAGCVPPGIACPAIMYPISGPVVVEVDPTLIGDGSLAACLGKDCEAAAIAPAEPGVWRIPDAPPYSSQNVDGVDPGAGVRLVIRDATGATVRDEWREIPFTRDDPGPCPGPITLQSIVLD
ncbi:hypothetical protein [Microbacterium sp. RURRCA19A]|uniref:hypothetical protein n=1 Tax=Microbacterium sp. RURRCA19A TaxID=1907391 RepID=UPI000956661D|nr:hypothetical protein [Microbacterium sp. RURRCA19A]SIR58255.1 hypothetical protein SAMN05880568_0543 [Microbacterium sp. RURRCA19A]